ncbi:MAG: restriction endonuclease [Thermoleophilia bacterium]
MSIPDYQTLMLPVLAAAGDAEEPDASELRESLAALFQLTEEDRNTLLPSGRQRTFDNRVHWAIFYLKKALLLESPRRGVYRITGRGQQALKEKPDHIDNAFLSRFPEFETFRQRGASTEEPVEPPPLERAETPLELFEASYQQLRSQLADELLQRVRSSPPDLLERLVIDLLLSMGYGSGKDSGLVLGQSGDGGVDGVINEDKLGLDVVYVQAKRWEACVGRPEIQRFVGSLEGHRASKGVFITTSTFSREAREHVRMIGKRIRLIDGLELAQLMVDYGVAVSEIHSYLAEEG